MTAGYILVFVILILGGVIATVSDRLGTKVGKARLSLFKLRPRDTAVVVTVMAGSILSAITLGILFATSKPLRTGVFRIDEIQKRLNNARREINQATQEKNRVESELGQARYAQAQAKANLEEINRSLQAANAEQAQTQAKLNSLRTQLNSVEAAKSKTEKQLSEVEAAKSQTESQLLSVEAAKSQTESQLKMVQTARATTKSQLDRTESQLKTVSAQKTNLGSEIGQLQGERQELIEQRERVKTQIAQRDREIVKREGEIAKRDKEIASRNELITQRDQEIAQRVQNLADRDRAIVDRDKVISEREELLETLAEEQTQLEKQQAILQQQMQVLERDFQAIREGTVAIRRGQILAAGVVSIVDPALASRAIDRLLQEANKTTVRLMQPQNNSVKDQVVQITNTEIDQLINQIKDGQDYVVRIVAGANYLREEKLIKVFAEAEINRVVFRSGDVISGISVNPVTEKDEKVRQQLEQLIEACQFRARLIGVVGGRVQVADNRIETLAGFVDRLQQYNKPLEVQAIATDVTYIAGPLKIDLVAVQNGVVVFRTGKKN